MFKSPGQIADPRVARITFTGETGTGPIIATAAAQNLTPVSLELGGKNANIVFADVRLDNAIDWSIQRPAVHLPVGNGPAACRLGVLPPVRS